MLFIIRLSFFLCLLTVGSAHADDLSLAVDSGVSARPTSSLVGAMNAALAENPSILAGQDRVRSAYEDVFQARAGYKPQVSLFADADFYMTDSDPGVRENGFSKSLGVNVSQLLYDGGLTHSQVGSAYYQTLSIRADFYEARSLLLSQVAAAYANVVYTKQALALAENNEAVITKQLEATKLRFEVGELTRTDVSQAQARLADARALVIEAKGLLETARAALSELTVQDVPVDDTLPELPASLPQTLDVFLDDVDERNFAIRTAQWQVNTAEENIDGAESALLPNVTLDGGLQQDYDPAPGLVDDQTTAIIGVSASMPLYTGGANRSAIRQSKLLSGAAANDLETLKRQKAREAIAAWEEYNSSTAEVQARVEQVEASSVAREGVSKELDVGLRTVLDLLDAEQEYLDSQIALIAAKRDRLSASYNILQLMGALNPQTFPGLIDSDAVALSEIDRAIDLYLQSKK